MFCLSFTSPPANLLTSHFDIYLSFTSPLFICVIRYFWTFHPPGCLNANKGSIRRLLFEAIIMSIKPQVRCCFLPCSNTRNTEEYNNIQFKFSWKKIKKRKKVASTSEKQISYQKTEKLTCVIIHCFRRVLTNSTNFPSHFYRVFRYSWYQGNICT